MLELLSTYDEASASLAKADAENCILNFIKKPDIFIMDHLLNLKPVAVLQGQPIHKVHEYGKFLRFVNSYVGVFLLVKLYILNRSFFIH